MTVKDFIKNHKKTILIGVGVVTGLALGVYGTNKFISNRKMVKTGVDSAACPSFDGVIADTLKDAYATYPGRHTTRCFIYEGDPVYTGELGILGEMLIKDGRKDETFTHFIAIGKAIDEKQRL